MAHKCSNNICINEVTYLFKKVSYQNKNIIQSVKIVFSLYDINMSLLHDITCFVQNIQARVYTQIK